MVLLGFLAVAAWLRYDETGGELRSRFSAKQVFPVLLIGLSVILIQIVLHELVHTLCLWWFTQEWPRLGFKGIYAYAAAPAWYIPRNQHLFIALVPLIVLTVIGLLLMPIVPLAWLP